MKTRLILTMAAVPGLLAAQHRYNGRDWRQHDEETIQRSFNVSEGSGPQKLLVDNISGYVHVTGYAGNEIQVKAQRRTGADSTEALQAAKRDVKLDMSQQGNFVRLYVDGPFRSANGTNYRGDEYYGYRVAFDYDIQVPAATEVVLKTINDGDIVVKKTTGDYEVNGLNGGIEMDEVGGSGIVKTLNGPVKSVVQPQPGEAVGVPLPEREGRDLLSAGAKRRLELPHVKRRNLHGFRSCGTADADFGRGERGHEVRVPFGPAADVRPGGQRRAGVDIRHVERLDSTAFEGFIEDPYETIPGPRGHDIGCVRAGMRARGQHGRPGGGSGAEQHAPAAGGCGNDQRLDHSEKL